MTLQTNKIARRISFASVAAAIVMFVAMSFTSVPAARAAVPADIQNRIVQTAATWRASTEQQKLVSPDPHMAAITGAMNRRVYSSMMAQAALLLASEPVEKVNGRVTYDQQILKEFGWLENALGRGVDTAGSGYSQV